MDLINKTVLITGASDGIGKAIALRLAREKCSLALIGRDKARLEEVKKETLKQGATKSESYSVDIQEGELLKNTIDEILGDFKEVNILINNAGIWQKMKGLEETSYEEIIAVLRINLEAQINLTRMILPGMKRKNTGAIINIISKSGVTAQKGQTIYSASKWGMRGFTEVLKEDLKETGIRVAGIYQAGTNTQMFNKAGDSPPVHNFTESKDLAEVIAFILMRPSKIWLSEVKIVY